MASRRRMLLKVIILGDKAPSPLQARPRRSCLNLHRPLQQHLRQRPRPCLHRPCSNIYARGLAPAFTAPAASPTSSLSSPSPGCSQEKQHQGSNSTSSIGHRGEAGEHGRVRGWHLGCAAANFLVTGGGPKALRSCGEAAARVGGDGLDSLDLRLPGKCVSRKAYISARQSSWPIVGGRTRRRGAVPRG